MWPCAARIVQCYRQGTSHGIHMDADGLLCAGEGLDQVTWMDVRIGTHLPTPRHGKPVEINAYWYNALRIMARLAPLAGADGGPYAQLAAQAGASFRQAFWMPGEQRLRDVISPPALPCRHPAAVQPDLGRIHALHPPSPGTRPPGWCAASVRLYGPPAACAPSTPTDPDFHPVYGGPQKVRDLAYHRGRVALPPGRLLSGPAACGRFLPRELPPGAPGPGRFAPRPAGRVPGLAARDLRRRACPAPPAGALPRPGAWASCCGSCEALERPQAAGLEGGWAQA